MISRMPRAAGEKVRRKDQIGWSKVLTLAEQKQFWGYLNMLGQARPESIDIKRTILMCELLFCCGLRETELATLRVQDTPYVLNTDVIEVYRGKNQKDRTIQIASQLTASIERYIRKVRPKTLPRWVRRKDYTKAVFYSNIKQPYTQRITIVNSRTQEKETRIRTSAALYRTIRNIGVKAGIAKRIYPHMFRHTFAVNALSNGVNIYVLQSLMGHSDITVTSRYLHLVNDQLCGLGDKLYVRF